MFTNPNVVVIATICVGLISAVSILISVLAKRMSSKWHDKEEELFVSLKDSVNAHTDHKIVELEKRITDRWDESIEVIFPKNLSIVSKLDKLKQTNDLNFNESQRQFFNLRDDIKLINEQVYQLEKAIKDARESILAESNYTRQISDKNAKIVMNHFDQLSTYKIESIKEPKQVFLDPFHRRNCKYCDKPINITKSKGNNRKFCQQSKDGIKNYCRDMYYKRLNKSTNV